MDRGIGEADVGWATHCVPADSPQERGGLEARGPKMKLHLGTLTRYYADGGPAPDPLEVRDAEVIAGAVSAWRHWLNKELPHALDWDESPTAPFEEAEVGETDFGALWMLAAHTRPEAGTLPKETPEDWRDLPPVKSAMEGAPESLPFAQCVLPNLWLPGDHDFLFKGRDLSETFICIGSSEELLRDLNAIEHHWKAELKTRDSLRASFESARDVLARLARRSVKFNLPLRRS